MEATNKDLTFVPQIDPTSDKLVRNKRIQQEKSGEPIADSGARLLAEAKRHTERRNSKIAKYETELQAQLAAPTVSE